MVRVPLPVFMTPFEDAIDASVVFKFSISNVVALPVSVRGAVIEILPAPREVVMAAVVVPFIVKLPPEIPTSSKVSTVREEIS